MKKLLGLQSYQTQLLSVQAATSCFWGLCYQWMYSNNWNRLATLQTTNSRWAFKQNTKLKVHSLTSIIFFKTAWNLIFKASAFFFNKLWPLWAPFSLVFIMVRFLQPQMNMKHPDTRTISQYALQLQARFFLSPRFFLVIDWMFFEMTQKIKSFRSECLKIETNEYS